MLVKLNDGIHNSEEEPIMIVLSKKEKQLISDMPYENKKFCSYPETWIEKDIRKFMKL